MKKFFSGNSVEQALLSAASHFDIDPDRVAYSVRDKKHGFTKVRRRIVIEVDTEAPELPPEERKATMPAVPAARRDPLPPMLKGSSPDNGQGRSQDTQRDDRRGNRRDDQRRDDQRRDHRSHSRDDRRGNRRDDRDDNRGNRLDSSEDFNQEETKTPTSESEAVRMAAQELLAFIKVTADVEIRRGDDNFIVDISAADPEILTDEDAEILQSMEYLIPRFVRGWIGQGVPVKVDYEGFRVAREERLQDLAYDMADQVRDEERDVLLEPMNPADRRIIHMTLADDPDVETESEGDGLFKRVRIFLVDEEYDDEYDDDEDDRDEDDRDDDE